MPEAPVAENPSVTLIYEKSGGKGVIREEVSHPELAKAKQAHSTAHSKAAGKVEEVAAEEYRKAVDLMDKDQEAGKKALSDLMKKHAPDEFKAVEAAEKKVKAAEQSAKQDVLKAYEAAKKDKTLILGHETAAEGELDKLVGEKIKDANKALKNATKAEKAFGIARTEGWVAAAKRNVGAEAWRESKMKAGFKTGVTGIGLIMAGDAIVRGQKKGEDGQMERRGMGGRLFELAVGVGAAGTAAFGGRVR